MCKHVCLVAVMYAPFVFTSESSFWNRQNPDNILLSAVSWGIFLLLSTLFLSHAMLFCTDFLSRKKEKVGFRILPSSALYLSLPLFFSSNSLIQNPHVIQVWVWKPPVPNWEVSSSAYGLPRVSVLLQTSQQVCIFMSTHKYFKNLTPDALVAEKGS